MARTLGERDSEGHSDLAGSPQVGQLSMLESAPQRSQPASTDPPLLGTLVLLLPVSVMDEDWGVRRGSFPGRRPRGAHPELHHSKGSITRLPAQGTESCSIAIQDPPSSGLYLQLCLHLTEREDRPPGVHPGKHRPVDAQDSVSVRGSCPSKYYCTAMAVV